MKVETINKAGESTSYYFDPQHKAEVIGFYQKIFWLGDITGYKATMDNGDIVAIGASK
jgi:hypothetical protein